VSSPAVVDGVVYVGEQKLEDGSVLAVDADSGRRLWQYDTGSSVQSSPAVDEGRVYIGDNDGTVYALTGDPTPPENDGPSPVVGDDPPGYPDGDSLYEDVNGNDRRDLDDVVTLFEQFESEAVRNSPEAYDFNENGRVDFDDIVRLFDEVAGT
jgi:hypothetical protein